MDSVTERDLETETAKEMETDSVTDSAKEMDSVMVRALDCWRGFADRQV
jgi:hypothetical protein